MGITKREIKPEPKKKKETIMIYIGFSKRTHKLYARVLCKHFKHCAPVIKDGNKYMIYQFVHKNKIVIIPVKKRDLSILTHYGWEFIKYNKEPNCVHANKSLTCVQFTKRFCNIKNIWIQTPDDLYKYLNNK